MMNLCKGKRDENSDGAHRFLKELFDEKSVLFLGCNPDHPLTRGLLEHYVIPAKVRFLILKCVYQFTVERFIGKALSVPRGKW